ncbi:MAG: C1 family peptidase [Bacteroidales bacterium]
MKKLIFLVLLLVYCPFIILSQVEDNPGTGLNFNDEQYGKVPRKAPLTRSLYGTSLPSSASLKSYAPTPLSQGSYGTCVGWSSTFCALTIIYAKANGWSDKATIDANTFSPGFVYSQIKNTSDVNCTYGTYIPDALDLLKTKGAPKYSEMDISCPSSIPLDVFNKAQKNTISDYAKLFDTYDLESIKIQAVKKSLSEGKPVVIGMKCPTSFNTAKGSWSPTEDPAGEFGGHAMCVIGYDDNQYGGAFEIQNSWGTWWGNQGYIWIKYDDFQNWVKYAYELIDIPKKTNVNASDLAGAIKLVESSGNAMDAKYIGTHYKMNSAYRSGTKFRIYISNNEPAFVYAFGTDATNKVFPIFPYQPGISPALNYKKNDVAIPDEDHYIEMDNTEGTDYMCVLYSLKPLNFDQIQSKVEKTGGTFEARIKAAVGTDLVDKQNIKFDASTVSFSAKSQGKSVVALIIETKHVK